MSRSSARNVELVLSGAGCRVSREGRSTDLTLGEGPTSWPDTLLAELPPGARVRATLGDGLLRYLVCRWPKTLRGRVEREAWLAHQFRQVHEIDVAQWRIAVDADAVEAPFIACAMPRSLEADLLALVQRAGARLVSLTGQFIRQYNAHVARMGDGHGALAVVDASRLTLGVWRDGHWTRVASQPLSAGDTALAARALAQLKVTAEAGDTGTLYACGGSVDAPAGWTVQPLEML